MYKPIANVVSNRKILLSTLFLQLQTIIIFDSEVLFCGFLLASSGVCSWQCYFICFPVTKEKTTCRGFRNTALCPVSHFLDCCDHFYLWAIDWLAVDFWPWMCTFFFFYHSRTKNVVSYSRSRVSVELLSVKRFLSKMGHLKDFATSPSPPPTHKSRSVGWVYIYWLSHLTPHLCVSC